MGKDGAAESKPNWRNFPRVKMGNDQSLPVPKEPSLGMFCISLRPFRKVELIHAPPRVAGLVQKVANEVNSLHTGQSCLETPSKDKLGVMQFTMAANLFVSQSGKEAATMGKLFCIRLLEELHTMGYDLQIGSDLTRDRYSASALFFKKVANERPAARIVCVAPGKEDRLILMNHTERVKSMVEDAIGNAWPSGIQRRTILFHQPLSEEPAASGRLQRRDGVRPTSHRQQRVQDRGRVFEGAPRQVEAEREALALLWQRGGERSPAGRKDQRSDAPTRLGAHGRDRHVSEGRRQKHVAVQTVRSNQSQRCLHLPHQH